MTRGMIFNIEEFSLHDGPGIRTTVFLKGCPLRCIWCHNPEGIDPWPQLAVKPDGCTSCGRCRTACAHDECKGFGRCVHACPNGILSVTGREIEAGELAAIILKNADIMQKSGGGVTLSGGEPLYQPEFTAELLRLLPVHKIIQTSGYAPGSVFAGTTRYADLVMLDIKLADRELHKRYTGVYNDIIVENLKFLQESGRSHIIRVPLIPDITDTEENLRGIAALAGSSPVELLPYNPLAGAKYKSLGYTFTDEIKAEQSRKIDTSMFVSARIV